MGAGKGRARRAAAAVPSQVTDFLASIEQGARNLRQELETESAPDPAPLGRTFVGDLGGPGTGSVFTAAAQPADPSEAGRGPVLDWERLRKETMPQIGQGDRPRVVLALDASGSTSPGDISRFFDLARSIPRVGDGGVDLKVCSFSSDYSEQDLGSPDVPIGAGTNFASVEQFVRERAMGEDGGYPDAVFVVTDGGGAFEGGGPADENGGAWHWLLTDSSYGYRGDGPNDGPNQFGDARELKDFIAAPPQPPRTPAQQGIFTAEPDVKLDWAKVNAATSDGPTKSLHPSRIVIAVDASGSTPPEVLNQYLNLAANTPRDGIELEVCTFTDKPKSVDLENPALPDAGPTDFSAVEEFVRERSAARGWKYADNVFVISDGEGFFNGAEPEGEHKASWHWLLDRVDTTPRLAHKTPAPAVAGRTHHLSDFSDAFPKPAPVKPY